jgi:hypothetical protein
MNDELILQKLSALDALNREQHNTILAKTDAIISQTTKTNGRVSKLEVWMNRAIGAMTIINLFVVPVLMWLVYAHLEK